MCSWLMSYENAYDLVRWDFVYYMLGRLGFCKKVDWLD